ncbi:MAG: carboxymuconolactone decarboxylase family protein [Deltaproteobacteria bacterium]|jgi:AhpD family alkylhydroperoxidase|nr:carboxymuconolactone decarboxylase family protein [Deltaproteobacteria bacterium]
MRERIIEPVSLRNADAEARAVLDEVRRGYARMPISFSYMAIQPRALKAFSDLIDEVMGDSRLEARYRELAFLKAAMLADCRLCTANHSAAARQVGITDEQIAAMDDYERAELFDDLERAILRFTEHVAREPGKTPEPLLRQLRDGLGNDAVIVLTQVIGIANLFSRFNNALHTYSSEDVT